MQKKNSFEWQKILPNLEILDEIFFDWARKKISVENVLNSNYDFKQKIGTEV